MFHSYDTETNSTLKIYEPEELIKIVKESVNFYYNQYEEATAKVKKTKEKLRREVEEEHKNELARLQKWKDLTLVRFNSQKEKKAYEDFWNIHNKNHYGEKLNKAQLGNLILYPYGNDLGSGLIVECPECHEKKDITDYTCW